MRMHYSPPLTALAALFPVLPTPCAAPPMRSVLLRDSFLDSFPPRDRPFMRQFTDTQMFAVYCDSVL